jgi:sporulation protein YlmC with PRC-barrel domain
MKHQLATLSLIALLAPAVATAQTAPPPSDTTTPPAGTTAPRTPEVTPPLDSTTPSAPSGTSTAVLSGQWQASDLMGISITNSGGETIGNVNDLIVDSDGRITSVVVGVGGFLGIGEKNVALPFTELNLARNSNDTVVARANATKESLKSAPEWKEPSEQKG